MIPQPVKVLIVDDSKVCQALLTHIIESDPQLKVIGVADSGDAALRFLKDQTPDVITMDIVMPYMDGFTTTRKIMQSRPIPIVVISSIYNPADVNNSFEAMDAGAVAILEKPKGIQDSNYHESAKAITDTIKIMSEVKLVTRHYSKKAVLESKPKEMHKRPPPPSEQIPVGRNFAAVAIGASLGGPQALHTILSELPHNFPVPIFIVQHIALGFIQGLVEWLNASSQLHVTLAKDGEQAKAGYVYLAPDKCHLEITKGNVISLVDAPPEGGCRPSVARLFRSMARTHGPYGIGIILTGMGRDGVEDLHLMKERGGVTIAQHKDSCVMYGMPEEAIQAGAATHILPMTEISPDLIQLVKKKTPEA